jgi:hypothetical protein
MRASLYLVGFAAVAVVGAGMTGVGCSSSSSGTTPAEDAATGTDAPSSGSSSGSGDDTGTGSETAAPCTPLDAGSAATLKTGSAVWDCYEAMCKTSLTACAADCACNNGVLAALQCVANDAGTGTSCFMMVTSVTTPPNSDLTTCLVQNAQCMNAGMGGGEGGTDGSTTTEAGPVDAAGGG